MLVLAVCLVSEACVILYTIVVVYTHGAVVAYVVMCLGEQMLWDPGDVSHRLDGEGADCRLGPDRKWRPHRRDAHWPREQILQSTSRHVRHRPSIRRVCIVATSSYLFTRWHEKNPTIDHDESNDRHPFNGVFQGQPWYTDTRMVKPIWILM